MNISIQNSRDRVLERESLGRLLVDRHAGQTVVFTNGCFDLLHPGHIRALEAARALGDILVVGINADSSVQRLKGTRRPIVPERERAEMLAALKPVDYVTLFTEDTPVRTIEILRPDIHVKSGDYRAADLPETPAVEAGGGRVVIVPFVEGLSTTDIVERIKERYCP